MIDINTDDKGLDKFKLLRSNHFCIRPFVHACVWTDKRVVPCCINHSLVLGHTDQQKMSEIFSKDNEKLQEFRKQLLLGPDLPASCNRCSDLEKNIGAISYRMHSNRQYGRLLYNLDFDENYELKEEKISLWDVRFSNLCNLKCRTCDPINSSKIAEETKKTNPNIVTLREPFEDKSEFLEFFNNHLDHIEEIYFCGGEPLLLEDHYQLLDILLKNNKLDLKLRYNSN